MRLSVNEVINYKDCPLKYKFKYVDMLPEQKDIKSYFRSALRQTISFYYFCMIDKKEKSLNNLFSKWEQLWFTPDIESTFTEEEVRERSGMAINLLKNFYRYTQQDKVTPVAVDFEYDAMFEGDTNLHVHGKIPLIKVVNDRTRKRQTDLVFFSYSPNNPDDFTTKIDLNTTLAAYAFRKAFETKESHIILCNIGKKQEFALQRSGSDFVRAKKILYNIATGIENRIFYPSDNRITCGKCAYKTFCMNEKAMEDRHVVSERLDNRK